MTVSPAQGFVRLRASGRDRARFLHNFCTNSIKDLAVGTACEAFFTDVKARVLAHGYVLALPDVHEIWILPGDPEALLKHLTRYIITDDVRVERADAGEAAVVLAAVPQVLSVVNSELPEVSLQPMACFSQNVAKPDGSGAVVSGLCFSWAGQSMISIAGQSQWIESFTARLAAHGVHPITSLEFERLRIDERFPIVGKDLSLENLAPEGERNATTISYTKGCYLGQEPIARLDAMGHVNRALRIVEIETSSEPESIVGAPLQTTDGAVIGTMTSACRIAPDIQRGLAMVRLASASADLEVLLASSVPVKARVLTH